MVYTSPLPYRVSMAKALLQEEGIGSVEMNRKDSSYAVIGQAELYVRREDVMRAMHIIEKTGW